MDFRVTETESKGRIGSYAELAWSANLYIYFSGNCKWDSPATEVMWS